MANFKYFDFRNVYILYSMWPFKYAFIVFPLNYLITVLTYVTDDSKIFGIMILLLHLLTFALGSKIVYDRFQQIHVLNSLTCNPEVTTFANHISSFSAGCIFLGYLFTLYLSMFKINNFVIAAVNIFSCFGTTMYMWLQCVVTLHAASLFYDKLLVLLRQILAIISLFVVISMAITGCVAAFIPNRGSITQMVLSYCMYTSSSGNFLCTALLYIYLLSFERDYNFIAAEFPTDISFEKEEECQQCNTNIDIPVETIQMIPSNRMKIITGTDKSIKAS